MNLNSWWEYLLDTPRWQIVAIAFGAYTLYYLVKVVKRPILASDKDSPFTEFLLKKVPIVQTRFWPTFWCFESRAQTIFGSILRKKIIPRIDYRREILILKDGGEVALDWLEDNCNDDAPCIIILPGLTDYSQTEYIKFLVMAAIKEGLRIVVFNNRGLGGVKLKTPRLYCASKCNDISEVMQHIRNTLPRCKLGAVGISMGGLILGNFLARHNEEARNILTAANIISVPWNVPKGAESIEKPMLNHLLGRYLAGNLTRMLERTEIHKLTDIDLELILKSKTIKEFDTFFTSKHFGYANVDEYYNDATLHNKLHNISVPVLCLSAADDPFQPLDAIPIKSAKESTHVAIVVTARGGHVGFLEGLWPLTRDQYMSRLFVSFFKMALFDLDGEFEKISGILLNKFHEKRCAL